MKRSLIGSATRPPQEHAVAECELNHPEKIQECMRVRGYDLVYGVTDRCNKFIDISDEQPYCYVPTNWFVYQVYRLRMTYEGVRIFRNSKDLMKGIRDERKAMTTFPSSTCPGCRTCRNFGSGVEPPDRRIATGLPAKGV
jgi:hypothetical protein